MPHSLALITSITVGLVAAFGGGLIARKFGLPSLVGYLLAGVLIGPFTPGFVGDVESISQLAEMGVIFLMFGVGLHFSLKDLWQVRRIAIPGAIGQMIIAATIGLGLTQLWGWTFSAGLVLGLAIAIASTVVLLRGLVDNGLLNTAHGQVAVGWLVLEDLATIGILVLLPALVGSSGNALESIGWALGKTAVFVALMLFAGTKVLPWLLTQIATTRSRELFILAVVAVALGTALGAAELFGVSLALGAFLAGVVIGESDVSHQVGAEVLPFRDIFAVLFFVSVGMLVNPSMLIANAGAVLALTALIVVGKALITILLGIFLPASGRTILVVAAGLSQIGEFSFIVGQSGLSLGVLTHDQYGLILASALLSIVVNPLMFRAIPLVERTLERVPWLWRLLNGNTPTPEPLAHGMHGHVVIVGYGRVGAYIAGVLNQIGVEYLVVEQDVARVNELQQGGTPTLFGDAANSELLTHAELDHARALVVTVPNQTTAELVVSAAHQLAPELPLIARAATGEGVRRLAIHGAQDVIQPELEGGLELVRHTLLALDYPNAQVQGYIDAVRRDAYDVQNTTPAEQKMLEQLLSAVRGMDIAWLTLGPSSALVEKSLREINLREHTGASVIALVRDHQMQANPKSNATLHAGDVLGLLGDSEQIEAAKALLEPMQVLEQPTIIANISSSPTAI